MARKHSRKHIMSALAGVAGLGKTPSSAIPDRLKRAYAKADDATKAAVMDALKAFLPAPGVSPTERRKAREVVSKFVMGKSGSSGSIESTGSELKVGGATVATRASASARFMRVCPGKFGGDKASRAAANAVLDYLHAGIKISDRDNHAFFEPHVGDQRSRGRIESESVCYNVEVPKAIDRNIALAQKRYLATPEGKAAAYATGMQALLQQAYGPGGALAKKRRAPAKKAAAKKAPAKKSSARRGKRK